MRTPGSPFYRSRKEGEGSNLGTTESHFEPQGSTVRRGFSKLQVLGCTCPCPVGLQPLSDRIAGVKGAVSRSVRRVGPVCGSGLQGGCAPAGHAAGIVQRGTRVGTNGWITRPSLAWAREWAQEWITRPLAWAHMYAQPAVKRQDNIGMSCQNTDRNVTNVRV